MRIFHQTCGGGIVGLLLLTGVTVSAFGQGLGTEGLGSGASSAGPKGLIRLRATVVCANCSLDEAKAAHPDLTKLYELSHEQGKVVIRVSAVNEGPGGETRTDAPPRWTSIGEPPQLSVRAEDSVFQQLVDVRDPTKEVEITGIIRTTRTLDISQVTVLG
jgi:hypothetical protein